jgi:hypothetical protein
MLEPSWGSQASDHCPLVSESSSLNRSVISDEIQLPSMSLIGDDEDTAIDFRESFSKAERAILQRYGFLNGPGTVVSLYALLIT